MESVRTPLEISKDAKQAARQFAGKGAEPFFVDIQPRPDAVIGECHDNVARAIAQEGGSQVFCWAIWENIGRWMEGEFHGLWRKPDGTLVDVTPDGDGEKRRLVVIDEKVQYSGFCIPPHYYPTTTDRNVKKVLKYHRFLNHLRCSYRPKEHFSERDKSIAMYIHNAIGQIASGQGDHLTDDPELYLDATLNNWRKRS